MKTLLQNVVFNPAQSYNNSGMTGFNNRKAVEAHKNQNGYNDYCKYDLFVDKFGHNLNRSFLTKTNRQALVGKLAATYGLLPVSALYFSEEYRKITLISVF